MGQCVKVGLMAQHFIWDKEVSVMQNGLVCYSGTKGLRILYGIKRTIVGLNGPVCYSGTKGPRTFYRIKKTIVRLNGHCGT